MGVPLASFIATTAGWRLAFMSMALLSLAAAAVLCSTLPPLAAPAPVRLRVYRDIFRNPLLGGLYGATACIITAHFAAFTYIESLLINLQESRRPPSPACCCCQGFPGCWVTLSRVSLSIVI